MKTRAYVLKLHAQNQYRKRQTLMKKAKLTWHPICVFVTLFQIDNISGFPSDFAACMTHSHNSLIPGST